MINKSQMKRVCAQTECSIKKELKDEIDQMRVQLAGCSGHLSRRYERLKMAMMRIDNSDVDYNVEEIKSIIRHALDVDDK